jgi:hypothetical protein
MGEELVLTLDASRGPPDSTPPQGEGVSSSRGMRRISRRDGFTDYLLMLDKPLALLPLGATWARLRGAGMAEHQEEGAYSACFSSSES